jgi:hypothetical protein
MRQYTTWLRTAATSSDSSFPTITTEGDIATLTGKGVEGDTEPEWGVGLSVDSPDHPDLRVALAPAWKASLAGVCGTAMWTPADPVINLPSAGIASGTTLRIALPNTSVVLQAGHTESIGFQWFLVNEHTTAIVSVIADTGVVVYGPDALAPRQCALVRQYDVAGFVVIASFPTELLTSMLATALSTNVVTVVSPDTTNVDVTSHPSGTSVILTSTSASLAVQLVPLPETMGAHWYVANATALSVPLVTGTNGSGVTGVVFAGSDAIPTKCAVLIRQYSGTEFTVVGTMRNAGMLSVSAAVFNSTVGAIWRVDGSMELPDDTHHPNGSTIVINGGSEPRTIFIKPSVSAGSWFARSWYVVNLTKVEIPLVPTLADGGGGTLPTLYGSSYIPIGRVIRIRQYAADGYASTVSHPSQHATPLNITDVSCIPCVNQSDAPVRNGTTVEFLGVSVLQVYSDPRTVGYTWFLNNQQPTQPVTVQAAQRVLTDPLPSLNQAILPGSSTAILHQVSEQSFHVIQFEAPRTFLSITTNNATLDGCHANRYCVLELTGPAPLGIVLSNQGMMDGDEIEIFNHSGLDVIITSLSTMVSPSNLHTVPNNAGVMIKYLTTGDVNGEMLLIGCLV